MLRDSGPITEDNGLAFLQPMARSKRVQHLLCIEWTVVCKNSDRSFLHVKCNHSLSISEQKFRSIAQLFGAGAYSDGRLVFLFSHVHRYFLVWDGFFLSQHKVSGEVPD